MLFKKIELSLKTAANALVENQIILRHIPQSSNIPQTFDKRDHKEATHSTDPMLGRPDPRTVCPRSLKRQKKMLPRVLKRRPTLLEMVKYFYPNICCLLHMSKMVLSSCVTHISSSLWIDVLCPWLRRILLNWLKSMIFLLSEGNLQSLNTLSLAFIVGDWLLVMIFESPGFRSISNKLCWNQWWMPLYS